MTPGLSLRTHIASLVALSSVVLAALGCRAQDQRTDSMDAEALREARESLVAEAVAALDSGGTAFAVKDYAGALRHYRRAAQLEPDAAAPWFGVFMAERALSRPDSAAAALERAQSAAPGATLLQDTLP